MRLVPWQSWEDWDVVGRALYSNSPSRISAALDRVAAWESRGHVPVSVEVTAELVSIRQRDPLASAGVRRDQQLPDEMLRMLYAMAIMRLVNGVVDQSRKRNTTSVAQRAEAIGLPRLMVDIRHEAAHNDLPGVSLLRGSSKQALAWLKEHYWDPQRVKLLNSRSELRSKLIQYAHLVLETGSSVGKDGRKIRKAKKQQQVYLFKELLDLAVPASSDVVSILVDDGLLEQETLPVMNTFESSAVGTLSSDVFDREAYTCATTAAWKLTIGKLVFHMPRLPGALLFAIIQRLNGNHTCNMHSQESGDENDKVSASSQTDQSREKPQNSGLQVSGKDRLITICAWLLDSSNCDSAERKISKFVGIQANFSDDLLRELLRICLKSSQHKEPLMDIVSRMAARLGNKKLHEKVLFLAQHGVGLQRIQDEKRESLPVIQDRICQLEDSLNDCGRPHLVIEGQSLEQHETTSTSMETAVEIAQKQQSLFFEKHSSQKICNVKANQSPHSGPSLKWVKVEHWLPSAVGMLPSVHHSSGIMSTLGDSLLNPGKSRSTAQPDEAGHFEDKGDSCEEKAMTDDARASVAADDCQKKIAGELETTVYTNNQTMDCLDSGKRINSDVVQNCTKKKKIVHFSEEIIQTDERNQPAEDAKTQGKPSMPKKRNMSLVQGCILQHGYLVKLDAQQFETVQSTIRVL